MAICLAAAQEEALDQDENCPDWAQQGLCAARFKFTYDISHLFKENLKFYLILIHIYLI